MKLEIVRKFFHLTFVDRKPKLASDLYLHEDYKHHDIKFIDGKNEASSRG